MSHSDSINLDDIAGRDVGPRRLLSLFCPYQRPLFLATLCSMLSGVVNLALPFSIRSLLDSVFIHRDGAALDRTVLLLVALVAGTAIFVFLRGALLAQVSARLVTDLRVRLYQQLQFLSVGFHERNRTGDLMSRLTTDTTLIYNLVSDGLVGMLRDVLQVVGAAILLLLLDWRLALVAMAVSPTTVLVALLIGRRTRRLTETAQSRLGYSNTVLEETLSNTRIVRAFNRERYELHRYQEAVEASSGAGRRAGYLRSAFEAVMFSASMLAIVLVLWIGGHEVLAGRLTAGGLVAFTFYLGMLSGPFANGARFYGIWQQAAGGSRRILAILDTAPPLDSSDARPLPPVEGRIELREVGFRYAEGGPDVVDGVSLTAAPNEVVALVGPSGAGKTTITALLLGLYRPGRGAILLDGHDSRAITIDSWRRAFAVVPQDPLLFGGSIRDNIGYGREGATEDEIVAAARAANAHAFIAGLPAGYDTLVGDRGVRLSGGQRQRIAIARALLKDAPVLILDEATSSLDNTSEALVQSALTRLMANRTTIVIAHRLTTVERATRIVVLDAGQIVDVGTHAELMQRGGLYYRLYTRALEGVTIPSSDESLAEAAPL